MKREETLETDWITRWACRLHEWLEPEEVRRQIAKLSEGGEQYRLQVDALCATLAEVERPPNYFGHTTIRDSQLPLVNSNGYFLRGWNDWNVWHNRVAVVPEAESVLQRLFADESPQTLVIIDHVENVHYFGTPRLPRFLPVRRSLEICQIYIGDSPGWRARLNDHNSVGLSGATSVDYVDFWDNVNGVEGTIRSDFILNRNEIEQLVRHQFTETEFPEQFCYLLWAYVFCPDIASEDGIPPGHSESLQKR